MVKLGNNLLGIHDQDQLPESLKELFSKPNVKKELDALRNENGDVAITIGNTIYEITYVRVIPPSDCMEEYKKREKAKLRETFNLDLI